MEDRNNYYIMAFVTFLHRAAIRSDLSFEEAREAMDLILQGRVSPVELAGFLVAMRMKGETAAELAGFAQAIRAHATPLDATLDGESLLDTAGTGGDEAATFNVSTVAAFVLAGAGARVAKHGNRSISSSCGSADLMEALGVRIDLPPAEAARALREIGIAFLFAPHLHPAMKHAQPVRRELKIRTLFNLVGPLVNPAGAKRQVIGAPSLETAELLATALALLGTTRAYVVHAFDGLDEISTTGPTMVYEVRGSAVDKHVWSPEDFGLSRALLSQLAGGDLAENMRIARSILAGEPGAARDLVVANAAAGLMAAGLAATPYQGARMAEEAIDNGAAQAKLRALQSWPDRTVSC
jgi:anthranilate phosphoribosyltransferase